MSNQITPNPSVPSQVVQEVKFPKFVNNLGIIPTSYKDSMSYYECLAWLCKFLEETVIPTVNENGEAVEELQNLYVELNSYVTHYFDTLDVQEEINNKLDDMVEAGTLQEIVASYLNSKAVFGFDTVAEMKIATNLINGSYAKTLGYYSKNDGGSGLYKIRTITNDDVVDNASIIPMEDNTLIAELITTDYITIEQFGAKGDGTTDDSEAIEKALNYATNEKILFHNKTYLCNVEVEKGNISIDGQNATLKANPTNEYPVIKFKGTENNIISNINIENLTINGNKTNTAKTVDCHGMVFVYAKEINLKNITIYDVYRCSQYFNTIENLNVNNLKCYNGGVLDDPTYGCVLSEIHNTTNANFENVIFNNYYGEGFLIRNTKNITVNNFKCTESTRSGNNAFTTDDCEHVTLSNFIIDDIAHQGVEINSTLYYKILNGIISNCQRNGLLVSTYSTVTYASSQKGLIENIKLNDNNLSTSSDTFDIYLIGVKNTKLTNITTSKLKLSKETSHNLTCEHNIIENSTIQNITLVGHALNGLTSLIIDNVMPLGNISSDPYSSYSLKTKRQLEFYYQGQLDNGGDVTINLPTPQEVNFNGMLYLTTIFTGDASQGTSKVYACTMFGVNASDIKLTELHTSNRPTTGRTVTITKGTNNNLIVTNASGVSVYYRLALSGISTNS